MKKSTLIAEFDQAVHNVDSSFPSLYTKDDVIKVLRDLETTLKDWIDEKNVVDDSKVILTTEQLDSLIQVVTDNVKDMGDDIIYDYELSINSCREVELDNADLHYDNIQEIVEISIQDWFKSLNEDDCGC
jgi:hypothetical protein